MMKHFLWCFGESQGVTIAFFDCIGRCVGTAPPTPRFAASTCGWRTLALGGFHRSALPSLRRLPLGELTFGLTASAFRHAPLRDCRWASSFFCLPLRSGPRRVGLRAHCFRFSACTDSGWPLGEFVLSPSASEIALGGLAFGFTASAFRHAPLRSGHWASSFFRLPFWRFRSAVGLRVHCFRFSARTVSELPFGELAFGLTASAFRHAPLRSGCWASSFFRLPLRSGRWAGWPSDSPLPLFGTRRSAPPHRRSEDRRSTTTRHLFHFKTLIPTC